MISTKFRLAAIVAAIAISLSGCTAQPPVGQALANTFPDEYVAKNGQLNITLTASERMIPYEDGMRWAMTYNEKVVGPTLVIHPGDQVNVTLVNDLTEATSLHTHGLHVDPAVDDPMLLVAPGKSHVYKYVIPKNQQAGTYWYHPHPHGSVAKQVASGLSGAIIVEDDTDVQLNKISTSRVLVINDPPVVDHNPWSDGSYANSTSSTGHSHGMGGMDMSGMTADEHAAMMGTSDSGVDGMTAMMGRTGPHIYTNGEHGVQLNNTDGKLERVHIVNASASQPYRLTYSGKKMLALSSSGGRYAHPIEVTSIDLSPGDRTELVLIPSSAGGQLRAARLSLEKNGAPTGDEEALATVSPSVGTNEALLPQTMTANTRNLWASDVKVARVRTITLNGHMKPTIDGKPFDMKTINFTANANTVEEWVIQSQSAMWHPIHLHTWPFQIEGQQGWTDIVMTPPHQVKKIRIAFEDFTGTTVIHCHVLDHEDIGMMALIQVK